MKSVILFATSLLALTVLCQTDAFGQATTPPRPVVRPVPRTNPTPPPTAKNPPNTSGRQDERTQPKQYPVAATDLRPVMSIEDVKFQPPIIKVLVMNRGKQKNKLEEIANLRINLVRGDKSKSYGPDARMSFWVTGKPKPSYSGMFSKGLSQQDINALPATTKIPQPFEKVISLPVIAPGESVWVSVDFTLPDPGTYAAATLATVSKTWSGANVSYAVPEYIDASKIDECFNLTAFFASHILLEMNVDFRRSASEGSYPSPPFDPPVNKTYSRQLPQAFFNFMNIPPGKYTGKCK